MKDDILDYLKELWKSVIDFYCMHKKCNNLHYELITFYVYYSHWCHYKTIFDSIKAVKADVTT